MNASILKNKHIMSLAGNGVVSFLGIATISFLSHSFTLADAGYWFLFLSYFSIIDAVRNGYLGTATVKFYAGTEENRAKKVLGSVWLLAILVTFIVLVLNTGAYMFLYKSCDYGQQLIIKWIGITFVSSLVYSVVYWKLQADEDYTKMLYVKLVNSGSTIVAFIALLILQKLNLETALQLNFFTNCFTSVVALLLGVTGIKSIRNATKITLLEIHHFGKYSLGTTLSANLLRTADTFMIDAYLGPAAVAVYNWPSKLMEVIEIPLRSFVSTGMSGMSIAYNQGKMGEVTYIFKKYTGMLTMAFIPVCVGVWCLADVAIYILGGAQYLSTEAPNIYRIFIAFALLYPIDRFNGVTLDIVHKPKINLYKVIIMLAVSIIGDYIGIQLLHNVYGVAIFSFATLLAGIAFGNYHLKKDIPYTIREILQIGYSESITFFKKIKKQRNN